MALKDELQDMLERHRVAFNNGDVAGACALYAEEAFVISPRRQPLEGRDAVEAFHEKVLAEDTVLKDFTVLRCEQDGDLAYAISSYATANENGYILEVFKRQPDGSWAVTAESVAAV